jgi:hypothetical protein
MDDGLRVKLGIAGLLLFEVVLAAFIASFNTGSPFVLVALAGAAALGYALYEHGKTGRVGVAPLAVLTLVTLFRAVLQTGPDLLAVLPSYLVAVGFAGAAYGAQARVPNATRGGIALVAVCRTFFIVANLGTPVIALANVFGALGAWVWASASAEPRPASQPAPA